MPPLLFKIMKMAPNIKDSSAIKKETDMANFFTKLEEFMMENGDRTIWMDMEPSSIKKEILHIKEIGPTINFKAKESSTMITPKWSKDISTTPILENLKKINGQYTKDNLLSPKEMEEENWHYLTDNFTKVNLSTIYPMVQGYLLDRGAGK